MQVYSVVSHIFYFLFYLAFSVYLLYFSSFISPTFTPPYFSRFALWCILKCQAASVLTTTFLQLVQFFLLFFFSSKKWNWKTTEAVEIVEKKKKIVCSLQIYIKFPLVYDNVFNFMNEKKKKNSKRGGKKRY